jgi:signal transduction histidine kinase
MDGIYAGGAAGSDEARVAAMAEGVRALRHALNNPLTALLAEAQMLEMDAPSPQVRAAAERMIALCRRMSAITKEIDPMRGGVDR